MQAAKKLVLVDPQFLEQLKADREYKQIQKPAELVAKTNLSLDIGKTLYDQSLSEDRKVKQYIASLHKYLNINNELPIEPVVKSNPLTEIVQEPPRKRRRKLKFGRQVAHIRCN